MSKVMSRRPIRGSCVIKVTPDPGVIEVNVHPAVVWREAVAITRGVYEEAHQSRLGTDKFMIDGRHSGTGGGNHVVLGGSSAADSPFLRRPDLLKSLVLYWQRRPSLSYLFSGLFIGPTSQAPRIDEARQDMLYELEIALRRCPRRAMAPRRAVARRSLVPQPAGRRDRQHPPRRDLHRQIVLARRPDRPAWPRGIPLLRDAAGRAHEPRAAIVAARAGRQVLARAARRRCVRWGTALHDRFMLEHFVWQDFLEVLDDLARAGYGSIRSGSKRSANSAFPSYGAVEHGGVRLELRHALEPWYVLGEEGVTGGTVRSSIPRSNGCRSRPKV